MSPDSQSPGNGPARVSDLERVLFDAFPAEWAEEWDRVGLLAGDPEREITGVLVTLDPTSSAIARAARAGANVVLTHHPAALSMPERITAAARPASLFAALDARIALIAEHTNLDRAPKAVRALPNLLGLEPIGPVESSTQPMTRVTVYVLADEAERVVDAMAAAGAGRVGSYERCVFSNPGLGEFTPLAGAEPAVGSVGTRSHADELRVEMVCARGRANAVVSAARKAHSYEEPLIVTEQVSIARSAARMGMLCNVEGSPCTLGQLALRVADAFHVTPRVWGSADGSVATCVTATGSAGSLLGDVMRARADAVVCGEVRYHDALEAAEAGLSIIEVGHDVSEWPLVEILGRAAQETPGLPAGSVIVESPTAAWWSP